jgi:hypothetical protein
VTYRKSNPRPKAKAAAPEEPKETPMQQIDRLLPIMLRSFACDDAIQAEDDNRFVGNATLSHLAERAVFTIHRGSKLVAQVPEDEPMIALSALGYVLYKSSPEEEGASP